MINIGIVYTTCLLGCLLDGRGPEPTLALLSRHVCVASDWGLWGFSFSWWQYLNLVCKETKFYNTLKNHKLQTLNRQSLRYMSLNIFLNKKRRVIFIDLFSLVLFWERVSLYESSVCLGLTVRAKLSLNSCSFCLCLPKSRTAGMHIPL